jgi:hypothetical protein
MRTIIAGSRWITDPLLLVEAITTAPWAPTEIVSGGACGVDQMGQQYAEAKGLPFSLYSADWSKYDKAAGPMRNTEMAKKADALIAIWDGVSKGTAHMIQTAEHYGLRVHILRVEPQKKPSETGATG